MVSTSGQWETQASEVAAAAGIRCVTIASVTRFLEAARHCQGQVCAFIDYQNPDVNWVDLYQTLFENGLEIPIVVVAEESQLMLATEAVKHCANFVITRPIDRGMMREAIDSAFDSHRIVGHQFAVQRHHRRLLTLSDRERSIVDLAVDGAPNKQIATRLGLSVKTIERVRQNAYKKLEVRSTAEMTRAVILGGLHDIYPKQQSMLG
ncbi:MAG: hypothetical protein HKN47_20260 [Pirellulaceae bacterium]|nr:hypothetical protein [Pirellulaceae bacterium]